jgi:hypothetical protein
MASNPRKYEIYTGLIILSMSVGILLAGEVALRLLQWVRFGQQVSVETSSAYFTDEATGLRLNHPNRQLGNIRINNLGFRGPDMPLHKPEGTVRLAFLGSSTTYDAYSGEGQNWPELVVSLIRERVSGCSIDFVNGGKPGYGSQEMISLFQHFVADTEPDLVLAQPSNIDKLLDEAARAQGFATDHAAYKSQLSNYSLLLRKLEKNARVIKLQRAATSPKGKLRVDQNTIVAELKESLEKVVQQIASPTHPLVLITPSTQLRAEMSMKEIVRAGNTQLYYMPFLYLPDIVALRQAYAAEMRDVALSHDNVWLVAGGGEIPADAKHFQDSVHFTPQGSRAMAERVVTHLFATGDLTKLLQARGCRVVEPGLGD